MLGTWVALLIALAAGASMAIQGSLNSALGKATSTLMATLAVHLIGTITSSLLCLAILVAGWEKITWARAWAGPWYAYLGGIISVGIIYAVAFSIPKIGVAWATTAIIVGQVTCALIIDHFGLFGLKTIPFTWMKLVGLGLLAAGAKVMLN